MNANLRRRKTIRKQLARRKRRVARRLDKRDLRGCERPMMTARQVRYEVGARTVATSYGGIAALHMLACKLELPEAIDARLQLLKLHLPYHESDHVLNLAYNAACGARCLDDLELRRQDEGYLDAACKRTYRLVIVRKNLSEERRRVLRMEFRTFVEAFIRIPCQVLRTGRQLVCRLLGWNRWQDVFFRAVDAFSKPLASPPARVRATPLLR